MPKTTLIAIHAVARGGKDSALKILSKHMPNMKRVAFADELKRAVYNMCMDLYGIDSFTEDPELKEIIRPTLLTVGNTARKVSPNIWIHKATPVISDIVSAGGIPCITDCRYENEADFAQKDMGGILIHLDRIKANGELLEPNNAHERENYPKMKSRADVLITASNLVELENELITKIVHFFKSNRYEKEKTAA